MARRRVASSGPTRTWGDELTRWRQEAGLRQGELAQLVNMHQTRVSQFELGKGVPTLQDAALFDKALAADGQLIRSYELVAAYLHDHHPNWFQEFVKSEANATVIRELQTGRISGLLQTLDYMRALFTEENDDNNPNRIEELVKGRLERQARLHLPNGYPRLVSILEQATLERVVGGPDVMHEQLQHLIDAMQQHNVIIQVLPFSAGSRAYAPGMVLLELPGGHQRVYSESLDRGHFIDDTDAVERLAAQYDRARAAALSETESIRLIRRIMRGLNVGHAPRPDSQMAKEQLLGRQRRQLHRGGPRIPRPRPRA